MNIYESTAIVEALESQIVDSVEAFQLVYNKPLAFVCNSTDEVEISKAVKNTESFLPPQLIAFLIKQEDQQNIQD